MIKRKMRCKLPMNLQFFAEPTGGSTEGEDRKESTADKQAPDNRTDSHADNRQSQPIDYAKIQQMLDGTLAAKEDTALKAYFKQQGLSQQEAEQAMTAFKAEKAKNQPDIGAIQKQASLEHAAAQKAAVENVAILEAVGMGIDSKTIPYLLKMADLSQAAGVDGTINNETVKEALSKVLEDIPQLKLSAAAEHGFIRVGAANAGQQSNQQSNQQTAVPTKRWNRFNN